MPAHDSPAAAGGDSRHGIDPFAVLDLSPAVLESVGRMGFRELSPIQAAAIPILLAGHDVVGQAPTGSGKTVAFCLPALQRVDPATPATQVLILAPTRELATQITDEVRKLAAAMPKLRAVAIYGGTAYERQFADLKRGAHIVVGTPGRLTDLMARSALDLSAVRMLVLDEADRMLAMGFREDIEKILAAAPVDRQTVFFSATIPPAVQSLVRGFSRDPRKVVVGRPVATGAPRVEQVFFEVRHHAKCDALFRLVDADGAASGIIFCNTQRMVDELADALAARGCSVDRLHGGMAQAQRTRVMDGFKAGGFRLLVATDVAARGIDVDDLGMVVNYDVPKDAEDYVHRIGRTGRAGRGGRALTLVSGGDVHRLRSIERFTATRIPRGELPTAESVAARRAESIAERLRAALAAGGFPHETRLVERLVAEGHAPEDVAAAILHHFAPLLPPAAEREPGPPPARPRRAGASRKPVGGGDARPARPRKVYGRTAKKSRR